MVISCPIFPCSRFCQVAEDLRPSIDEFEAVKVSTSDQTFKGTRRKMKWVATATLIMHYSHRHRGIRHTYVGRIMNVFPCLWNPETQCCTWSRCSWNYQSFPPAFGCWHPVPKSMVWCRTCISVFASYNTLATKMLLFPGESKVIQTSSKLVHLGKASSIFVGGPPMFVVIFWKCFFKAGRRERLESLALNSDYVEV